MHQGHKKDVRIYHHLRSPRSTHPSRFGNSVWMGGMGDPRLIFSNSNNKRKPLHSKSSEASAFCPSHTVETDKYVANPRQSKGQKKGDGTE